MPVILLNLNIKIMKKTFILSFVIASTLVSQMALASGAFRVSTITGKENKAILEISDNADKKYEISILDASGDEVYYNKVLGEQQNFKRMYDLSKLDLGVYKVEVKTDGELNEQFVTVGTNGIEVSETVKEVHPFFKYNDNSLILTYLNYRSEDMSLSFYNNDGLIWSKEIGNKFDLQKAFDLSQLEKGNYKVILSSQNRNYEYDLTKE